MGMTIDESIEIIEPTINIGASKIDCALEIATETMRKYQKIVEIVEHWACCGNPSDSMIAISEVLENGNDDR